MNKPKPEPPKEKPAENKNTKPTGNEKAEQEKPQAEDNKQPEGDKMDLEWLDRFSFYICLKTKILNFYVNYL